MKRFVFAIPLFLLLIPPLANAGYHDEIKTLTARVQELAQSTAGLSGSERFKELVDIAYDYTMLSYPEYATYLGDPRGQDRWTDQSMAITRQREQDARDFLAALENIHREDLSASERVNYDLLYDSQKREIEGQQFPGDFRRFRTHLDCFGSILPVLGNFWRFQAVLEGRGALFLRF